jgi:hypothetical protein
MVAARVPMSDTGFRAWLAAPLPGVEVIANPESMWTGWRYDGTPADWGLTAIADSPAAVDHYRAQRARTPLHLLAERATRGFTLARHHGGALEVYLYDYHGDAYTTQTDLLMLAGAGRFADAESPVLHWGGDVYPDLPMAGDPPLAMLLVSGAGARFTASYPLDGLLAHLRPVEAAFLAAAGPDGSTWDPSDVLDPAIRAQLPPTAD